MRKQCAGPGCDAVFDAKRNTAKYCSKRCSVRASRQQRAERPAGDPGPADSGVEAASLAELTAAGRAATAGAQAVLALARRIDSSQSEPGSAVAAMVREHRAALADAVKDARAEVSPVDELRSRRELRAAGGG